MLENVCGDEFNSPNKSWGIFFDFFTVFKFVVKCTQMFETRERKSRQTD